MTKMDKIKKKKYDSFGVLAILKKNFFYVNNNCFNNINNNRIVKNI